MFWAGDLPLSALFQPFLGLLVQKPGKRMPEGVVHAKIDEKRALIREYNRRTFNNFNKTEFMKLIVFRITRVLF